MPCARPTPGVPAVWRYASAVPRSAKTVLRINAKKCIFLAAKHGIANQSIKEEGVRVQYYECMFLRECGMSYLQRGDQLKACSLHSECGTRSVGSVIAMLSDLAVTDRRAVRVPPCGLRSHLHLVASW